MTSFEKDGVKRKQPPVRVTYCDPQWAAEPCPTYHCKPPFLDCAGCGFTYGGCHGSFHSKAVAFPVCAWKGLLKRIRKRRESLAHKEGIADELPPATARRLEAYILGGKELHRGKPARIYWCHPPSRGQVDKDCAMQAATCTDSHASCLVCRFPHCAYHRPKHRRHLLLPSKTWRRILRGYEDRIKHLTKTNRKAPIRIDCPTNLIPKVKK